MATVTAKRTITLGAGVHTIRLTAAGAFTLTGIDAVVIVEATTRRSSVVTPQAKGTARVAGTVAGRKTDSRRRSGVTQAVAKAVARRAGSSAPFTTTQTGAARRSGKADTRASLTLQAVAVYNGIASDPVEVNIGVSGNESFTRRAGVATLAGVGASRRSATASGPKTVFARRSGMADAQTGGERRRSGTTGDRGSGFTFEAVAVYNGIASDPVDVTVSFLGSVGSTRRSTKPGDPVTAATARRSSKTTANTTETARRSSRADADATGTARRASTATAGAAGTSRRSGTTEPSGRDNRRRAGSASAQATDAARRSGTAPANVYGTNRRSGAAEPIAGNAARRSGTTFPKAPPVVGGAERRSATAGMLEKQPKSSGTITANRDTIILYAARQQVVTAKR